jgi:hypothetical protein
MKFWLSLLAFSFATSLSTAAREPEAFVPLAERTPAYFVDRYGPARSTRKVSQHAFLNPQTGTLPVKGEFSVREFRTDGLRVRAVFHVPSLKLAEVTLQMAGRTWTDEQVIAALKAYGHEWKLTGVNLGQRRWTTPDRARAILLLTSLHIQPPKTVAAIEQAGKERDAQRKAVPKF